MQSWKELSYLSCRIKKLGFHILTFSRKTFPNKIPSARMDPVFIVALTKLHIQVEDSERSGITGKLEQISSQHEFGVLWHHCV